MPSRPAAPAPACDQVVSRDLIRETVWDGSERDASNTITVHIQRLRARLDWTRYAPHRARWVAQEEALFAAARPWERADVLVDNRAEIPRGTRRNRRGDGSG